jgi:hypothetical protein
MTGAPPRSPVNAHCFVDYLQFTRDAMCCGDGGMIGVLNRLPINSPFDDERNCANQRRGG